MGALLEFVTMNFWLLLLILVLIGMKRHHRIGGIVLLAVMVVWGFVPWVIITITITSIIGELYRYATLGDWDAPARKKRPQGRKDPDYDKR